ncbi:HEXXH motif domain-containing protein [Streptomyces chiangmaiensis]|uniref:HEXXH motif domain-containing protein n=1 Tax=Streptomyces chiangmaiensis TaxID=766497 RepID=A0ABU7FSW4_9ACTN|nr:HEXXH motif domain-containing protein [Streptomyces chiangmaiensis]MED7827005.1 HEXXH motif domain-containing protein [Streptomyces chiangmaiensis]
MPDHLFGQLATGGGSPEALAFLERGERARRLLLLRTLLDRLDVLPTPLTPPARAWAVVKEAAEVAPHTVEQLLLAPSTGSWLGHVLRRSHGTSSGPPMWAEAGHLCALAVVAAVRAGTTADLLVPLMNSALHLPGLGRLQLPGVGPHPTVGRARVDGGEVLVDLPGAPGVTPVRCRPATVPAGTPGAAASAGPHWLPLRTLALPAAAGGGTVLLDDLDPYRDLDEPVPAERLDDDEALAWQRLFDEALELLGAGTGNGLDTMDGPGRLVPAAVRVVVPWGRTATTPPPPPFVRTSATSGDAYGAMVISRPATAVGLAETLVHEFQHSKLAALLHLFELIDDDRTECHYAPWRPDPRHLPGLLHGAYAFTAVTGFWRDRLADDPGSPVAAYHFALRRLQTRLVVRTLLGSGRLTAPGRRLVSGLAATLDGWLRDPVDVAALTRARTAAALHRTEWRLRNLVHEGPSAGPRLRSCAHRWADTRTHAFAEPPAAPRTADEYLAAGDFAGAVSRYATLLAGTPDDPATFAGWIVARAALHPGRGDTRRALARPELLTARPRGEAGAEGSD